MVNQSQRILIEPKVDYSLDDSVAKVLWEKNGPVRKLRQTTVIQAHKQDKIENTVYFFGRNLCDKVIDKLLLTFLGFNRMQHYVRDHQRRVIQHVHQWIQYGNEVLILVELKEIFDDNFDAVRWFELIEVPFQELRVVKLICFLID